MTEEEVTDRKELMSENNRKIHTKTDGVKAERNYAPLLYAGAIVLAVTSVILIAVFLIRFFGVVHLTSDTEGSTLTDSKNGVVYSLAPISYTADLDTDSVYAKYGDTEYYRLYYKDDSGNKVYCDPKEMIGTENEFGVIDIYVAEGIVLPELKDFGASKALICTEEMISYAIDALTKEETEKLINVFFSLESCDYPSNIDNDTVLSIYFRGDTNPFLLYNIRYFETKSGEKYFYDRVTSRCVNFHDEMENIFD